MCIFFMGITTIWEAEGIYRQASGPIDGQQFLQAVIEVEGDPRFPDIRYVINDFSTATELKFNNADILAIGTMDKASNETNAQIVVAFVVGEHQVEHLYTEYNNLFETPPYPNRLFKTPDEARDWVKQSL